MAGDWIKMRGALTEHPKVIAVSRALHSDREFREWLTPGGGGVLNGQIISSDALRCVTCALLMRLWSRSREHGEFIGDDLILRHSTIADLDQMAGAPGIGAAVQSVGWAVCKESQVGVTLPHFKEYNVPMTAAEKQKAYRERVTKPLPTSSNEKRENVTSRVEKRRVLAAAGAPPLKRLRKNDLSDIGKVVAYGFAAGLPDERKTRLRVTAYAARALAVGDKPAGLFAKMVSDLVAGNETELSADERRENQERYDAWAASQNGADHG